ncbi:MAG TPA: pilus assembly protein PilM [Clostridiales bacterium]|nr:pilus assembly protein PilM [Clostridiales bacterium]
MNIFANRSIGVEFDDYEIRTVELQKRPGGIHLAGCHRVSLPPDIVKDGRVAKPKELSEYIKSLWTNNKLYKDNIILGLSNQDILIRKITLPLVPKDRLDLLVANNAQDYIPTPLENAVLDYMVVGHREVDGTEMLDVLIVAAASAMVEDFYQCFSSLGYGIKDIKVSALSIADTVCKESLSGNVVLVDISNNQGGLVIYSEGEPMLARQLRINLVESTGLVPSEGYNKMELMDIVLSTWVQILYNEIRSSIQYFQTQENVQAVDKILLSGCGSRIMGLDKELESISGISVEHLYPIEKLRASRSKPFGGQIADFATCIGLALVGLE